MGFEWDDNKNNRNIVNHGIDFNDAINVFTDPHYIVNEDARHDYGEVRLQVIGTIESTGVIFVVYTERDGDVIRIISARQATKSEKRLYQKGFKW